MTAEIPWQLPPHRRYVFRHAGLVDPVAGVVHPDTTVVVADGIVESVYAGETDAGPDPGPDSAGPDSAGPDSAGPDPAGPDPAGPDPAGPDPATPPPLTTTVDLAGKFLCPGLIDCHVHLSAVPGAAGLAAMRQLPAAVVHFRAARMARAMLGRGFTAARDCGGTGAAMRDAVAAGAVRGPRLFVGLNQLTQTGGHGDPRGPLDQEELCCGHVFSGGGRLCDGADGCRRVARDQLRRGADFLKIMGGGGVSTPSDAVEGVQFSAAEAAAVVEVAAAAGTYVSAHAYSAAAIRQAVGAGVRAIEHGNLLDAPTAALLAARGVFLTPTLATYAAMADPRYAAFLPASARAKNAQVLAAGRASLRLAAAAGVTLCFGTDLLGPMAHRQTSEFRLRAEVPLPAADILRSATVHAARLLRQEHRLGQLRPGFAADLLVLNASPLDDICVLDRPQQHLLAVVQDGRVVVSRWRRLPADVDVEEVIE